MKKLIRSFIVASAFIALSVACGDDDPDDPTPTPVDSTAPDITVTASSTSINLAEELTISVTITDNTRLKEADITFKSKGSPTFQQSWSMTSTGTTASQDFKVTVPPNRYVGDYEITGVVRDAAGNDKDLTAVVVKVNCPAGKAWCK